MAVKKSFVLFPIRITLLLLVFVSFAYGDARYSIAYADEQSNCELINLYSKTTTTVNDDTVLSVVVPQGAVHLNRTEEEESEFTLTIKSKENNDASESDVISSSLIPLVATDSCAVGNEELNEKSSVTGNSHTTVKAEELLPENFGLLIPSIQLIAETSDGVLIQEFYAPVSIEIVNSNLQGLHNDDIVVRQPTSDGVSWHEIPFEITGDTLIISTHLPGEIFVWHTPMTTSVENPSIVASAISKLFEIPMIVIKVIAYLGLVLGIGRFILLYTFSPLSPRRLLIVRASDLIFFMGGVFMFLVFFSNINLYTSFLFSVYLILVIVRFKSHRPLL